MYAAVNKINLYYQIQGSGLKTIILLHGNGEDHTIFDKLVPHLIRDYKVIQVDLRGHGKSDLTTYLDYNDMAQDIYELITTLHLKKPIILGFSDGAIISLILAINHPFLLKAIVACGPNINPNGIKMKPYLKMKMEYLISKEDNLRLMLEQPNLTSLQLKEIRVPTLIMGGANDLIKSEHLKMIANSIQNAKLIIYKDKDHFDYIVHSDYLYKDLDFFLRKDVEQ